jgi:uncharacterized membrane protein YebE (DUF533 family)
MRSGTHQGLKGSRASTVPPFDLKLDLFFLGAAFVLDIVGRAHRNRNSFASDFNFETFAVFLDISLRLHARCPCEIAYRFAMVGLQCRQRPDQRIKLHGVTRQTSFESRGPLICGGAVPMNTESPRHGKFQMINVDKILGQILNAGQVIDGKPFDGKSLASGLLMGGLAGAMTGKAGKKIAGTALKVGGAAAVAGLAYSAYQRYREGNPGAPAGASPVSTQTLESSRTGGRWSNDVIDITPLQEAHFLPAPQDTAATESLSLKLVRAMIAAAKADGQIDGSETDRIFSQVNALDLNDEERAFLLGEINKPRSAQDVAASAETPEEAAEIYAVSVMAVNPNGLAERLYLGDLSRRLKLEPALATTIHDRVQMPVG